MSSVFAADGTWGNHNQLCDQQNRLCDLRTYAKQHLKKVSYYNTPEIVCLHISSLIRNTFTSEFNSELNQAKAAVQYYIDTFEKLKPESIDTLKSFEDKNCSEINSLAKTWLQLTTYCTEGKSHEEHYDPANHTTAYRRCADALSRIKYYEKDNAELEGQLGVLEKIKSGLNECITSKPVDKTGEPMVS